MLRKLIDLVKNNKLVAFIILIIVVGIIVALVLNLKEKMTVDTGDDVEDADTCRESCSYCRKHCPFRRHGGCLCPYCRNSCPFQ